MAESELAGQLTPLLEADGPRAVRRWSSPRARFASPSPVTAASTSTPWPRVNSPLSAWLDEHDPMPGRYTLEVSSPGLERRLRTPAHFKGADRRDRDAADHAEGRPPPSGSTGTLVAADDDGHRARRPTTGPRTARYDEVERARTVFVWGAAPKPSPSKARAHAAPRREKGVSDAELRVPRRPGADRARLEHRRGRAPRGARERAARRVQAAARLRRGRRGHDRPRVRRDQGLGPRARPGGERHARVGRDARRTSAGSPRRPPSRSCSRSSGTSSASRCTTSTRGARATS